MTQFPQRITPYLQRLITTVGDPVRRQFAYSSQEEIVQPFELDYPIGGDQNSVTDRLIHLYPHKALFLTTLGCVANCRFCFRKTVVATRNDAAAGTAWRAGLASSRDYVADHPEITELLLSGGDVFALPPREIGRITDAFRSVGPTVRFRFCTRVPVVDPARITADVLRLVETAQPAVVVLHVNHPDELTVRSVVAIRSFLDRGVPVWTQSVLLRGVNDASDVLLRLYRKIAEIGMTPYYLFQLDLIKGASHFLVDLEEGRRLVRDLIRSIEPGGVPTYALDVPGKGGKVDLLACRVTASNAEWYTVTVPPGARPDTRWSVSASARVPEGPTALGTAPFAPDREWSFPYPRVTASFNHRLRPVRT